MYCTNCGAEIKNGSRFCTRCGKPVNSSAGNNPYMARHQETNTGRRGDLAEQQAKQSYEAIRRMNGYYCLECGNYINHAYGDMRCRFCRAEVIGGNYFSHSMNILDKYVKYGLIGGMFAEVTDQIDNLRGGDAKSAYSRIVDYYRSDFYRDNRIPFEQIASDKGLMGEYLVDRQFQMLKASYPGRSFHALYNLYVPEPNGSFAEIDAVIIYGKCIFVVEAKNRNGKFYISHLSDEMWDRTLDNTRDQIHSPLMQNEFHIDVLDHYLKEKNKNLENYFINAVALAGNAGFDQNIKNDAYDNLVVRSWTISNTSVLCNQIVEFIQEIDQNVISSGRNLQQEVAEGLCSEKRAQQTLELLRPLTEMTQEQKDLYMHDREMTGSTRRRYPWQYFYIGGMNILTRYNGEIAQCIGPYIPQWTYIPSYFVIDDEGVVAPILMYNLGIEKKAYILRRPLDLVRAWQCLKQGVSYKGDSRDFRNGGTYTENGRRYGNSNSNHNNNRQQSSNTGSSGAYDSIIFFSGCDTLEKLNSSLPSPDMIEYSYRCKYDKE